MTITHILLFQFKATATPESIKADCARFLGLGQACLHPTTQKPYLVSIRGGRDNAIAGSPHGSTHGFVVEFASAEDREHYAHRDPAHAAFIQDVGPRVEKLTVLDFTPGEF